MTVAEPPAAGADGLPPAPPLPTTTSSRSPGETPRISDTTAPAPPPPACCPLPAAAPPPPPPIACTLSACTPAGTTQVVDERIGSAAVAQLTDPVGVTAAIPVPHRPVRVCCNAAAGSPPTSAAFSRRTIVELLTVSGGWPLTACSASG